MSALKSYRILGKGYMYHGVGKNDLLLLIHVHDQEQVNTNDLLLFHQHITMLQHATILAIHQFQVNPQYLNKNRNIQLQVHFLLISSILNNL